MANPWEGLDGPRYELIDLGRPATFFLPSHKLQRKMGKETIEEHLRSFLHRNFQAFTTTTVPYFGFWRDNGGKIHYDECRLYEVSFKGKERIPALCETLAEVARVIGEESIYLRAGQYTCLVKPKQKQGRRRREG